MQEKSSQREYAEMASEAMMYPRDQFELTAFSFDTNDPREVAEAIGKFSSLVGKDILLSNLDEKVIPYYQEDARIITHIFSLACRDEGVRPYFKVVYFGWKHELAMTRTKNGKTADLLAAVVAMRDKRMQPGFGSELQFGPEEEEEKKGKNIIDKILGR